MQLVCLFFLIRLYLDQTDQEMLRCRGLGLGLTEGLGLDNIKMGLGQCKMGLNLPFGEGAHTPGDDAGGELGRGGNSIQFKSSSYEVGKVLYGLIAFGRFLLGFWP